MNSTSPPSPISLPASALSLENAKLKLSIQVAGSALADVDYATGLNYLSAEAARLFGLGDSAMVVPRSVVHATFHPDDLADLMPRIAASLDPARKGWFAMDHRIVWPSGEVRWLRVRKQIFFDGPEGALRPSHAAFAALDVTDERNTADALRASEDRMRLATEATGVGIWEWNVETDVLRWDAQMFRIYGIAPTSDGMVPYQVWRDAVVPADLPQQEEILHRTARTQGHSTREFRINRVSDSECRLVSAVEVVRTDAEGKAKWVVGTNLDITERRQAKDQMRISEVRYRRLFEAAHDGVLLLDPATSKITDANPFMSTLLGYSRDELIGKELNEIGLLKDEVASLDMFDKLKAEHEVRYENLPLEHESGGHREVEVVANVYDEGGHSVIQCNIRDITARKRAELVVNQLAAIVECSDDAIIGKDLQGIITSWNKGAELIFGYTTQEMVGTSIMRLIPDDRRDDETHILSEIKSGHSVQHFETLRQTKVGQLIHVAVTASPIKDTGGKIIGVSKVARDITVRKLAEEVMLRSKAMFTSLVAQAPVGVYVVDAQFRLQQINPMALPDFETITPLVGRDFSEIVHLLWPKKVAAEIEERFRHTLATGEPYQAPDLSGKRKDTCVHKVYSWSLQRLTLPDGEFGVVCFFNDITERKQEESTLRHLAVAKALNRKLERSLSHEQAASEALKASQQMTSDLLLQSRKMQEAQQHLTRLLLTAQEDERKRVSRELHDVIAQSLTGINFRLASLLSQTDNSTAELQKKVILTQQLIEHSVDTVHRFARDLRPAMLDDLGLIPALKSYLADFTQRTNLSVMLTADAIVDQLNSTSRTVLYRIAQEALTNVANHAQASRAGIRLQRLESTVLMEIQDDGQGFAVEGTTCAEKPTRLGLLGMKERVEMIGGTFAILSKPGGPTIISVAVPAPDSTLNQTDSAP